VSNVLAIIPARGGSKRLPNKNLFPIAGKPLIAHTIEQAQASKMLKGVLVSSDDQEILAVASRYSDVELWERPRDLATDLTSTDYVLEHILQEVFGIDIVVLLQCTSPVREPEDIDNCVRMITEGGFDSVLSVVPSHSFLWSKAGLPLNYQPKKRPRSQDFDGHFVENGSIYAFTVEGFRKHRSRLFGNIGMYPMGKGEAFEIDTAFDAFICESIMTGWKNAPARIEWFESKGAKEQWLALT
jgi:CMP-N,N'-diacetyllegionaminic acid synthase